MRVTEVFTPGKFPNHTYVERDEYDFETQLKLGLDTNEIISISGPSKSGKSVLVQNVVGDDLIEIRGTEINSIKDLWNEVLDELNVPDTIEETSTDSEETSETVRGGLSSRIPGFGGASIEGEKGTSSAEEKGESRTFNRKGLKEVENILRENEVIFIDDFHYIDREVQGKIAQSLKEALWREISICVALVPHRSDDLERANSDLRGRVKHLKMNYWDPHELEKIADKGFNELNIKVPEKVIEILALEAAGSPHLMQKLCLEVCIEKGINSSFGDPKSVSISYQPLESVFKKTAHNTNHSSVFEILDSGPKTRGKDRIEYQFDGNSDDVYRCLLRAIAADPPQLKFRYEQLKSRTEEQCVGGNSPRGRSITETCKQMANIMEENFPEERYIEWDPKQQILAIPDPYLLFYLRWSDKLNLEVGSDYQRKLKQGN